MEENKDLIQQVLKEANKKEIDEDTAFWVSVDGVPRDKPTLAKEWLCTDTYEHFVDAINEYLNSYQHLPELIVFNCCLSEAQKTWLRTAVPGAIPDFSKFKTKSGYHCISFIMQLCDELKILTSNLGVQEGEGAWILLGVLDNWSKTIKQEFRPSLRKVNYEIITYKELEEMNKNEVLQKEDKIS